MRKFVYLLCAAALFVNLVGCGAKLPVIEMSKTIPHQDSGGSFMSSDTRILRDAGQLVAGNPWREDMEITTLPVYKSGISLKDGYVYGMSNEEMEKQLQAAIKRYGTDATLDRYEIDSNNDGEWDCINLSDGNGNFIMSHNYGSIGVEFVREGENYDLDPWPASTELAWTQAKALSECLTPMLGYKEAAPIVRILLDISDVQNFYCENQAYDAAGNDLEDILNFNFAFADLLKVCNREGVCQHNFLAVAEKMGDYPAISAEEARNELAKGNYLRSGEDMAFPGLDEIVYTEMVYNTSFETEFYVPFYRFWVETTMPEPDGAYTQMLYDKGLFDGLKQFAAFYVPAIQSEYIAYK